MVNMNMVNLETRVSHKPFSTKNSAFQAVFELSKIPLIIIADRLLTRNGHRMGAPAQKFSLPSRHLKETFRVNKAVKRMRYIVSISKGTPIPPRRPRKPVNRCLPAPNVPLYFAPAPGAIGGMSIEKRAVRADDDGLASRPLAEEILSLPAACACTEACAHGSGPRRWRADEGRCTPVHGPGSPHPRSLHQHRPKNPSPRLSRRRGCRRPTAISSSA